MPDENPSNAVLAEKINSLRDIVLSDKLEASKKQDDILAQVIKTNGRVGALEKWKNIATGILLVFSTVVIPLLVALAINYLTK
jgi:hypothetical protein